ncbi:MAG: double-strand break repair protein AddB [Rhodospirillaceae bacterium]|nr:MAG: double-strand break repair protein AddB [Rhodospirillaceae bacterium]
MSRPVPSATWRSLIARGRPTVFTIPPGAAFVDALAGGLLDDAGDDPMALAAVTVLLPTRRAARSLREAFLRLTNGKPLLLPRMIPLNDVDSDEALFGGFATGATVELPAPIAPLRRQLMLAHLIESLPIDGHLPSPEQAVQLAEALAQLVDQVQTEGLEFAALKNLVPDEYAAHWQITLKFLAYVTDHWPEILREDGAIDPAEHRNRVFAAQAAIWMRTAPGPIVAAGSTGSIPATAALLAVVAGLPEGCVVLPGLDTDLDDTAWTALDESHPQFGLKHLLERIGIERENVASWPAVPIDSLNARRLLVSECMRPAATTDTWTDSHGALAGLDKSAVAGVTRIDCPGPREEAETIALIMRDAVQTEQRTCALVTPDRRIAERVAAELERWDIVIDDSAGKPLDRTPPGVFLRLTAAMVTEDFAPVATLAACKHPFASAGRDPVAFRDLTRAAEISILRGPRPPAGLSGLAQLAKLEKEDDVRAWHALLTNTCARFAALMSGDKVPLSVLLAAHMEMAEAFAATPDTPGPLRLWAGEAGEAAAAFVAELAQNGDVLKPIAPSSYLALFETLMASRVVRPRYSRHPRLAILGPLEMRLQRFDVLILAGLNEGTWPADAAPDPWMSRPMRAQFGLPSPERRIGLAAHDVAQALCAPKVVLTRAAKVDGTPTVPSRWLMRLERVIAAAKLENAWRDERAPWLAWAHALTRPAAIKACDPPAPRPPVAARPRRLSVTEIEKWMRDPYSIYARHVLGLEPLDPLEQDPGAADYGQLIHSALHRFIAAYPMGPLPEDALARLLDLGRAMFADQALRPGVAAFWEPRFERVAAWFVETERERRNDLVQAHVEIKGEMTLKGPAGPFTLTGRADRIDHTKSGLVIIDYKTGAPPSSKEVLAGYAPQLPLEAAMVAKGGFTGVPPKIASALEFWRLHGRDEGGEIVAVKGDPAKIALDAEEGLAHLIATFDQAATAYEARPNPDTAPTYSDYLHLARVKEWSAISGEDGS